MSEGVPVSATDELRRQIAEVIADYHRDIAYDLHERAAALRGVGNQKVGVTVDDLALDEMDGNQNAEPRWSANRLEEVLREGLPDQNAEPEAER